MQNICKFIPPPRVMDQIQTINFIYESRPETIPIKSNPVYRVHYVTEGVGSVCMGGITRTVNAGDLFFVFPAVSYEIKSIENLRYMYISYIGIRAGAEMERLGITPRNFVFEDFGELGKLWWEGITLRNELLDLTCESLLLYTLSKIGSRALQEVKESAISAQSSNFLLIKQYIDDNYADPDLSCENISLHFSYNKKYISRLFKKNFRLGITEYIHTIRVNHACILIEKGLTNVGEIAEAVGFRDALYFSKVFKRQIGSSPKQYIAKCK